jgi:hypothetical protein
MIDGVKSFIEGSIINDGRWSLAGEAGECHVHGGHSQSLPSYFHNYNENCQERRRTVDRLGAH